MTGPHEQDSGDRREFVREMGGVAMALLHRRLRERDFGPDGLGGLEDPLSPEAVHLQMCRWTFLVAFLCGPERMAADPDDPDWRFIIERLRDEFLASPAPADQDRFERQTAAFLEPRLLASALGRDPIPTKRTHGCFRWVWNDQRQGVYLHFHNTVKPKSPFEDLAARRAELRELAAEVESAGLCPGIVACASWINGLAAFRSLFPKSYAASLCPEGPYPTSCGWWGQLVTHTGAVNRRRAERIRREGRFEHVRRIGCCGWKEFKRALRSPKGRSEERNMPL